MDVTLFEFVLFIGFEEDIEAIVIEVCGFAADDGFLGSSSQGVVGVINGFVLFLDFGESVLRVIGVDEVFIGSLFFKGVAVLVVGVGAFVSF